MKPENIKKVWEHYRGFQIRYRIGRSQYIIDAFNKNMNGDFSPSLFVNPIESKVHLIVKEYIKCLLEQEALEQAQQEQTTIDTQQKSSTETQPQEQSTPTFEKTQKKQTQQLQAHNSPPIPRKGGVRQSREVVKETHRKQAKARRAKAPALKFTKEILGQVSRSDGGVKNRSATEEIKMKPVRKKLSLFPRGTRCLHRRGIKKAHNSPLVFRRKIGRVARSDEVVKKLSQNFCGFHRVSLMFILSFCPKKFLRVSALSA